MADRELQLVFFGITASLVLLRVALFGLAQALGLREKLLIGAFRLHVLIRDCLPGARCSVRL
ncbi:hypothetical protein XB05_09625 [Xanthomonas arboricola]|uniref:hypothetical protein n=1 Tax=Xanthomonas arboricola TaxID=56448 RepID=UPI00061A1042|nr:hypothetical protein [Xanthomonas arboricola]AKC78965.1 hypothetical protein XB05_09625 [Xanthomonas arboricola]